MTLLRASAPFFLFFSAALLCYPAVGRADTLEGAVSSTLSQHPTVESAKAVASAADESRREEISGYFPELSVNSTAGRIFGDNATSRGLSVTRGEGYSYLWEGQATARQMIFDGFETQNRVEAAKAREMSADLNLADVREGLALRAAQSYLNVMRARTGLGMLVAQQKLVEDYLGRIKSSVDDGVSDEAEHQQARDVTVILEGFVSDYEAQVRAAEAEYFELTGHLPEGELAAPRPQIELLPQTLAEAMTLAKESHPSLAAAQYQTKSSEFDIESEEAGLYPDVNGELSYLKSDKEDIIGGEVEDGRAVMRMNWNFETGGAQLARIRQKKYEHQEALSRTQELERQIELGVKLAYSELQTAQQQLENSRKRQELNEKLFETFNVQFEGARITLLQLMQSDNQRFNTKLEKMNGEYRVLAAQYAALASMGRLQGSLNLASSDTGPLTHEQH